MISKILFFLLAFSSPLFAASWPTLSNGDRGSEVRTLQHLLRQQSFSLSADGIFGTDTLNAVRTFQERNGLPVTGVVDSTTWPFLTPLLRSGDRGEAVTGLQHIMNKHSSRISEDGIYGQGTYNAVYNFQVAAKLSADGITGNDTWRESLGMAPIERGMTVGEAVYAGCSTTLVKGISLQLVNTVNACLHPGTMVDFSGVPNISLGSAVFPYMQRPAKEAFERAMRNSSRRMTINSAYRSVAQQLLLYQWYLQGRCGIGLAARPGTSNHESGLAFDCNDGQSWSSYMSGYSFKWLGPSDPPHFDYVGSGSIEIRPSTTKAFQMLWNANNPNDRIAEDGLYGPNTEKRLLDSPADGFPINVSC